MLKRLQRIFLLRLLYFFVTQWHSFSYDWFLLFRGSFSVLISQVWKVEGWAKVWWIMVGHRLWKRRNWIEKWLDGGAEIWKGDYIVLGCRKLIVGVPNIFFSCPIIVHLVSKVVHFPNLRYKII